MSISAILAAIQKDFFLEVRKAHVAGGLVVFVLSVVYIMYVAVREFPPGVWNALFWIAFLFAGIHTTLKSFGHESSRRYLYYYTILSPEELFVSKCIYNSLLLGVLGLLMYGTLLLVAGSPVVRHIEFAGVVFLGAVSISLCFTFVSAIAIKSDNSATLMTIMSFPVIIPALLHLTRLSELTMVSETAKSAADSLMVLGGIDALLLGLGFLLFPYLWRS